MYFWWSAWLMAETSQLHEQTSPTKITTQSAATSQLRS
jgi:hypothetical protein